MPTNTWLELLDKAEAEGGGDFTPIPDGDYDFVIFEAEATKTNDGTKDMIKAKAKIVTGDFKNRIVFHNFTISPESAQALNILQREFAVLGLNKENFWKSNPDVTKDFVPALLGKPFRGSVKSRVYNEKTYFDIKRLLSATEAGRQAAAAVLSGAPSDAPAPSVAPSDAPPPAPAAAAPAAPATPAPVAETPAEAPAPPVPSGAVPPPPPPPAPPSNF